MGTGYLLVGNVLIAIDCFSSAKGALKAGEVRDITGRWPLRHVIFEAISGRPWDETIERLDKIWREGEEG